MTSRLVRALGKDHDAAVQFMDRIADGAFLVAADLRIIDVNAVACQGLGYTRDELLALSVTDISIEAQSRLKEASAELATEGFVSFQTTHSRKDGTTFPVQLYIGAMYVDGLQCMFVLVRDLTESHRVADDLRDTQAMASAVLNTAVDGIITIDETGQVRSFNPAAEDLFGYTADEVVGRNVSMLMPSGDRQRHDGYIAHYVDTGEKKIIGIGREVTGLRKDGTTFPLDLAVSEASSGSPRVFTGIVRDITERKRMEHELEDARDNLAARVKERTAQLASANEALTEEIEEREQLEEALRQSEERYRTLYMEAPTAMHSIDASTCIVEVSATWLEMMGYERHEVMGRPVTDFLQEEDKRYAEEQHFPDLMANGYVSNISYKFLRRDGEVLDVLLSAIAIRDEGGNFLHSVASVTDVTERLRAEAAVQHMAYHDSLTGLPNRELLKDHLNVALGSARRNSQSVAVMFVDLDRFKIINDTMGHSSGDELLQQVANQLAGSVRDDDTVARVGGDEFILLLPDISGPEDASIVAERTLRRIAKTRTVADREIVITASLGISMFPGDGADVDTLLSNADTAMYRAKDLGKNRFEFYDPAMSEAILGQLELENDLRRALRRDEFVVHYQPQVSLSTGEIVGVEALIRWQHPERGLLPPDQFLGAARETGLIIQIGQQTLRTASAQQVAWRRAGHPPLRLAVNFDPEELRPHDSAAAIATILKDTGMPVRDLVVEITEQQAIQNLVRAKSTLEELKAMGLRIAIDDFGTGHSSLSHLSQLPVDVVKIDRSFVSGLPDNADDVAIVVAIIAMGHGLELSVIAEGIETVEQLEFLKERGCDEYQGFLFSKALPAQEFEELLKTYQIDPRPANLKV